MVCIHPLFEEVLNSWATHNRIIPQDWKDLTTTALKADPQLQWKMWRENN